MGSGWGVKDGRKVATSVRKTGLGIIKAGRHLTAINVSPNVLFQLAYETSSRRILNPLPDSLRQYDDLNLICFDLIVPPAQESSLRPIMREALRQYLPVRADWVPMTKPAYVLRRIR